MDSRSFRGSRGGFSGTLRLGARFTPGVKVLIGLFAGTWVLTNLGRVQGLMPVQQFVTDHFVLRPAQALGLMPWQLLTGPALQTDFIGLLFTVLLLWSLGSAVEQQIGTRPLLRLSAVAAVAAAVVAAAVGRLWPGRGELPVLFEAGPMFLVLTAAFGRLFQQEKVTMWGVGQPVSAWGMSLFFMGLSVAMYALHSRWLELAGGCAAAVVGLSVGPGGRPRPWMELRRLVKQAQLYWHRRNYKVLDGGVRGPQRPQDKRWMN